MRLLERNSTGEFSLQDFADDDVPRYAILSHTWGAETEEVSFKDLMEGTGKGKLGYDKIRFCAEQASRDGLQYFWVDSCCIDKSNNNELTTAINSMFRWYHDATRCYVYLSDVSTVDRDQKWEPAFRASRWFTRGWTLQELLAPSSVEFFSRECKRLGDKQSLERLVHEITKIPLQALQGVDPSCFGVDERFSWAKNRETTRKEDQVYSLLGIFNVFMPLIYGEGREHALIRLKKQIEEHSKEPVRLSTLSLFKNKKYKEVEKPFRLIAKMWQESLDSLHLSGHSLFKNKKYRAAEKQFRLAAERRETFLGPRNRDTLRSFFWLGRSLYEQGRYKEAEKQLREVVEGDRDMLTPNHKDLLNSTHWLGRCLFGQKKYKQAEKEFREAAEGRITALGPKNRDTLRSFFWLGRSLYEQRKCKEANEHLGRVLKGDKAMLGPDHEDTVNSIKWLARIKECMQQQS